MPRLRTLHAALPSPTDTRATPEAVPMGAPTKIADRAPAGTLAIGDRGQQIIAMSEPRRRADDVGALRRERASLLPRALIRFARAVLRALHESRRRQAEGLLRRHAHLVGSAGAPADGKGYSSPRPERPPNKPPNSPNGPSQPRSRCTSGGRSYGSSNGGP